jgi:hypothetical protein
MLAVFAQQLLDGKAVFRSQYPVVPANTTVLFAEQFIGGFAVLREQVYQAIQPDVRGLFAEQFNGGMAVFRDQFWFGSDEVPGPVPTKVAMKMLSSGKVLLINGRILITQI